MDMMEMGYWVPSQGDGHDGDGGFGTTLGTQAEEHPGEMGMGLSTTLGTREWG